MTDFQKLKELEQKGFGTVGEKKEKANVFFNPREIFVKKPEAEKTDAEKLEEQQKMMGKFIYRSNSKNK